MKFPSLPLIALPFLLILTYGCVSGTVVKNKGATQYDPTIEEKVVVYQKEPTMPYEVLGRVFVQDAPAASSEASIRKFKAKAAELGADAIIIDYMPQSGMGDMIGVSTPVQGQGRAIKFKK